MRFMLEEVSIPIKALGCLAQNFCIPLPNLLCEVAWRSEYPTVIKYRCLRVNNMIFRLNALEHRQLLLFMALLTMTIVHILFYMVIKMALFTCGSVSLKPSKSSLNH